jgi:hypothetical protein
MSLLSGGTSTFTKKMRKTQLFSKIGAKEKLYKTAENSN